MLGAKKAMIGDTSASATTSPHPKSEDYSKLYKDYTFKAAMLRHHPKTAVCEAFSVSGKVKNRASASRNHENNNKTYQQATHRGKKLKLVGGGRFRCGMLPAIPSPNHTPKNARKYNQV